MARTVPVIAQRAHEKSSSPDADLVFVTITHPEMADTIRLVIDGADYVMDGATWSRSYFELDLVTDTEEPPRAQFSFPNVDRAAMNMLSRVNGPARVEFRIVSSAYFDLTVEPRTVKPGYTVENTYQAQCLDLRDVTADDATVSGTLASRDLRQEVYPNKRVTKALLPGAYMR